MKIFPLFPASFLFDPRVYFFSFKARKTPENTNRA